MCALPSSQRLNFKLLTRDQLETFYELVIDPHIRHFLMEGMEMSKEECLELLSNGCTLHQNSGLGLFLILQSTKPIGYAGFMNTRPPSRDVDIVYAFKKEHTGQGFATEVCAALVTYFKNSHYDGSLTAVVHPKNTASIRVLEKNQFKNEGAASGDLNHLLKYRLVT